VAQGISEYHAAWASTSSPCPAIPTRRRPTREVVVVDVCKDVVV
jgi:hypothetical protein